MKTATIADGFRIDGFRVISTRGQWRVYEPNGALLAVRGSFRRAVLRAIRAARAS